MVKMGFLPSGASLGRGGRNFWKKNIGGDVGRSNLKNFDKIFWFPGGGSQTDPNVTYPLKWGQLLKFQYFS